MRTALALMAQFAAFWSLVAVIPPRSVTLAAWTALYAIALVAFLYVDRAARPNWSSRTWLAVVFYSLFFAGIFYGANLGLDVLHGANRPKAEVARYLGGVEIWFFLCPGVSAFALAGLVQAFLSRRRDIGAPETSRS